MGYLMSFSTAYVRCSVDELEMIFKRS